MSTFTQHNRFISIETPLGPDDLGLVGFTGSEELGRLFQYNVELVSDNPKISFDDLIGQKASIRLETTKSQQPRYFHGYISRMTQLASRGRYARYHATIVPWLWLLTRTSDCCIFQDKTIPQILQAVFKRCGVAEFELRLTGTYSPLTYCVQYRETDFNFVSRLMEQEGIYYFFKHEKAKHTLVLADSPSAHAPYPGYDKIAYRPTSALGQNVENILDWGMGKELQPGAYAHTDFNYETPSKKLLTQSKMKRKYGFANLEIFDYPGEYSDTGDGDRHAKIRIQELQSHYETLEGEADSRGICAGYTFTLEEHPRSDQDRKYLVKSTHVSAHAGDFESEGAAGGESDGSTFHCSFMAFDASENFRPERMTPKPMVHGIQTAKVVGPAGETINTDNFGRVKVQFHWDRYAKGDDTSSCWVRASQPWGGGNWGGLFIPHVGQEVIISFEEGDPDRPIITGRVYNADQMPPVVLPAGKTQSTISDYGGNQTIMEGKDGVQSILTKQKCGNEFLMDGTSGKEKILLQQKCGNEFLMDGTSGQEKILLQDKYGNSVTLDAVKGTLRLYSPTHKSEMVLGNSVEFFSLSDWNVNINGKDQTIVHGPQHQNYFGLSSKLIGGIKQETVVGADIKLGWAFKIDKYKGKSLFKSPLHTIESSTIIVNAKTVCYIGNKGKKSQLKISPQEILLFCGDSKLNLKKDSPGVVLGSNKDIELDAAQSDVNVKCKNFKVNFSTFDANSGTFKVLN